MLRRYLAKHNLGVDLENMDFEAVDKEMEANEASVADGATPEGGVDEWADDGQDNLVAWISYLNFLSLHNYYFFLVLCLF